ncbi:MAG: hypothetical protein JNJ73_17565 [Hyphomonadaceae bacterium]|nr:hypothetical protein [Hyphomonadaceae bacterium]
MRWLAAALVAAAALAIASPAQARPRVPTPAECAALIDARDRFAPGVSLRAIPQIGAGGPAFPQMRLRAIAAHLPSEILPELETAMARTDRRPVELNCADDRETDARRGRAFRISLPVFSADGRWMTLAWFKVDPPVGSEGYQCAFERSAGRWVARGCELIFIS